MKRYIGLLIIGIATFLSFLIANISKGSDPGLGGFILLFWPPILGGICMIVFLIISVISKNTKVRLLSSLILATYIIYVGLGLYVDKDWPLVY